MNEETLHEQLKNIDSKVTLVWDKVDKIETDVMSIKLKLASMPCEVHKEKMLGFAAHIENGKLWRTGIAGIAIAVMSLAVAWGALQEKVLANEKELEHCCDDSRAVEKNP